VELRQKFGLLALIYVLSLSANFAMSAWCIVVYFESAFVDFRAGTFQEQQITQARRLLHQQHILFDEGRNPSDLQDAYEELERRLSGILNSVRTDQWGESEETLGTQIVQAARQKDEVAKQWLTRMVESPAPGASPEELDQAFDDLDGLLLRAGNVLNQERQTNETGVAATQQRVLMILMVNTACGAILCAAGVFFVRRWVMQPIADLREATRQISQGDFAYRIRPRAHDELGQLAEEVNQMSATVVEMQTQLVEQERLAAAGEMVTRLAHNIRNPLAGIRGLAETTLELHTGDADTAGCQQRIIDTVDRFEKWLRDLQQSVSPLELSPQRISVRDLLNNVVTALRPMLDRHGVRVEVEVDPNVHEAHLDSLHFEQALVALVTNAVQASTSGQVVQIRATTDAQGGGRWQLTVADDGVGIPHELHGKIFVPYFTTKPEGNGIGLAMANKVVRLHGGQLTVESELGRGSRFSAVMPGLASEA